MEVLSGGHGAGGRVYSDGGEVSVYVCVYV